jgi:hypothetical protein
MTMKQSVAAVVIVLVLLGVTPQTASARDEITGEQAYLLARIAELKLELERLQVLLAERVLEATEYVPYQVVLFTKPVEAKYQVIGGFLQPEAGKKTRLIDEQLFNLFKETLGEATLTTYLAEWRVFYDSEGDIDAFAEQIAGTDKFVLNINRAGLDVTDASDQAALEELFVHEYAHMLLLPYEEITKAYEQTFWRSSDEQVSRASLVQKEKYFKANEDRFVSKYSLNSVDEDMAEIFRVAVLQPSEVALGERQEKYNFLRDLWWIGNEIARLEERLK